MPEAAAAALVTAQGLRAGYNGVAVCAPVDLTVVPGEVVALVGPNGTGKSTVLRTVLGLQEPLGGQVRVLGAEPDEGSAEMRARVASVLDEDAWFPGLTTREHLQLVAAGHGVPGALATVDAVVDTFGLGDRADVLPAALSSGQRRRLLLAAAFVRPCDLLVLDEPEQRLDTAMRAALADLLRDRAASGTGVLAATHDAVLLRALDADAVVLGDDVNVRMTADRAARAMHEPA